MALIVVTHNDKERAGIGSSTQPILFSDEKSVQKEFCRRLEWEEWEESEEYFHDFWESESVREYLKEFGVEYLGEYCFRCEKPFLDWSAPENPRIRMDWGKETDGTRKEDRRAEELTQDDRGGVSVFEEKSEYAKLCAEREKKSGGRHPVLLDQFMVNWSLSPGGYVVKHDLIDAGEGNEYFATSLNYPLQMACLALYYHDIDPDEKIIVTDCRLLDGRFCVPLLLKRDIYLLVEEYDTLYWWLLDWLRKEGVEVIVNGISSKDERAFAKRLVDLEAAYTEFSRELDAEVFKDIGEDFFVKRRLSLKEYVTECSQYDDEWERERLPEELKELLEEHSEFAGTVVLVNGPNRFDGLYRRYPIHWLFYMDGKWKYIESNSVKNPSFLELLEDVVIRPEPFDVDSQSSPDVSGAEKIFAMVLNCDERCNARKYWEHICFFVKYDKAANEMEICDTDTALLEFHELLQASGSLFSNETGDSWGGEALEKLEHPLEDDCV